MAFGVKFPSGNLEQINRSQRTISSLCFYRFYFFPDMVVSLVWAGCSAFGRRNGGFEPKCDEMAKS